MPERLALHAEGCDACSKELAVVGALREGLRDAYAGVSAQESLVDEVWRRRDQSIPARGPRSWTFALGALAGAAAAVALVLALQPSVDEGTTSQVAAESDRGSVGHSSASAPARPSPRVDDQTDQPPAPTQTGLRVVSCVESGVARSCSPGVRLVTGPDESKVFKLSDGTTLHLDYATVATLGSRGRRLAIERGDALLQVDKRPELEPLRVQCPTGEVTVLGTTLRVQAGAGQSVVGVVEGRVTVASDAGEAAVVAGHQALLRNAVAPSVTETPHHDQLSVGDFAASDDPTAPNLGFGTLKAHKPGSTARVDSALRLVDHQIDVQIQGAMAKTVVEESFANDTGDTLEGVYSFTLPAGAQIAGLELKVGDVWERGAVVARDRGDKIWRGVIRQATPKKKRRQQLDYIWVPGPWKDPALLNWQQGNTFELRIFPIDARSERRVRIAYTERLALRTSGRRYVYPLPDADGGGVRAENFSVSARVGSQISATDVRVKNYEVDQTLADASVRIEHRAKRFTPEGDLVIDLPDSTAASELFAAGYKAKGEAKGYALFSIRPQLAAQQDSGPHDVVFVVDGSYSTQRARLDRAATLVREAVAGLKPSDRAGLVICRDRCVRASPKLSHASGELAATFGDAVKRVDPLGTSRLEAAFDDARDMLSGSADRGRIVYLGDGIATVGETEPDTLIPTIATRVGRSKLFTVSLGGEVDRGFMQRVAARARGTFVDSRVEGTPEKTARRLLARLSTEPVRDVTLVAPAGMTELAPARLSEVWPGDEIFISGRVSGDAVRGELALKGSRAGSAWSRTFDTDVTLSPSRSNAFIPRVWAEGRIADYEATAGEGAADAIVALSKRHHVLSRFTSLIVLESPAMARAFGVEATGPSSASAWDGSAPDESVVHASSEARQQAASPERDLNLDVAGNLATGLLAGEGEFPDEKLANLGVGKTNEQKFATSGRAKDRRSRTKSEPAELSRTITRRPRRRRGGQWVAMKKVWYRTARWSTDSRATAAELGDLSTRERRYDENPASRDRLVALVRSYIKLGHLDRAEGLVATWLDKDRFDVEALVTAADVAALRGDAQRSRDFLASAVEVDYRRGSGHARMRTLLERAGDADLACAHARTHAQVDRADVDAQVAAVRCGADRERVTRRLSASNARKVKRALKKRVRAPRVRGSMKMSATWESTTGAPVDLDINVIQPSGRRISWQGGGKSGRASDVGSSARESLAFRTVERGRYKVVIVRANAAQDASAVTGKVVLNAHGAKRTVRFTLPAGESQTEVAVADVKLKWRHERAQ